MSLRSDYGLYRINNPDFLISPVEPNRLRKIPFSVSPECPYKSNLLHPSIKNDGFIRDAKIVSLREPYNRVYDEKCLVDDPVTNSISPSLKNIDFELHDLAVGRPEVFSRHFLFFVNAQLKKFVFHC